MSLRLLQIIPLAARFEEFLRSSPQGQQLILDDIRKQVRGQQLRGMVFTTSFKNTGELFVQVHEDGSIHLHLLRGTVVHHLIMGGSYTEWALLDPKGDFFSVTSVIEETQLKQDIWGACLVAVQTDSSVVSWLKQAVRENHMQLQFLLSDF